MRPHLYAGSDRIGSVLAFLDGYSQGLYEGGLPDVWGPLLVRVFEACSGRKHGETPLTLYSVLMRASGDDEVAAFKLFRTLILIELDMTDAVPSRPGSLAASDGESLRGMVCVRFADEQQKHKALGYMAGRFTFTTFGSGETVASAGAVGALAAAGLRFSVDGPATDEQLEPLRRKPAPGAVREFV